MSHNIWVDLSHCRSPHDAMFHVNGQITRARPLLSSCNLQLQTDCRCHQPDLTCVLLSLQAPLFTTKATIFPNSVFVIGFDTAVRLVMPKYYGGETGMMVEFAGVHSSLSRFLVAGRVNKEGQFQSLEDMTVPEQLQEWVSSAALQPSTSCTLPDCTHCIT